MWARWNDLDRMLGAMNFLHSRMNRIFSDLYGPYGFAPAIGTLENTPRTNLYDAGDHLEVMAEVPGIPREDLNIKVQGNYLEISGARKTGAPEGYTSHKVERRTTSFNRSFTLPTEIDVDKVEASLKNGLLTLVLPKAESAKPRKITIH